MKEIYLSGGKGQGQFALVDDEDFESINKHKWWLSSSGYACRSVGGRKNRKTEIMHRVIHSTHEGVFTDHVNQNKLDNRRINLRTTTKSLNAANSKIRKDNTSGFRGVSYDMDRNKWAAKTRYMNKTVHLGRFDTIIEAAKAYNIRAKELFGEFAQLNEIN